MELIGKQIAIETILGQPPELHYPSWYAAQIEKLPPAPPEYLAEQAGILVTDADTISRQAAIDAVNCVMVMKGFRSWKSIVSETVESAKRIMTDNIRDLPPALPEPKRGRWIYKTDLITAPTGYWECSECKEGRLLYEENFCPNCGADMREVTE